MFIFFPCPLPRDHICDQKKDLLQQFAVFVRSKNSKGVKNTKMRYICYIIFSQDFDFKEKQDNEAFCPSFGSSYP